MTNLFTQKRELFKEIYLNLKAHKLRTILTAFGIAWGVFILVILLGISGGMQEGIYQLFKGFSSKTIWFYGGQSNENISFRDTGEQIKFKFSEIEKVQQLVPHTVAVSPEIQSPNVPVFVKNERQTFTVKGVTDQSFKLKNLTLHEGRAMNQRDIKEYRNVAIVGDRVIKSFFNNNTPIGHYLSMNGIEYRIIGVINNKSFLSMNEQSSIFIPYTTFAERIQPVDYISSIGVTINQGNTRNIADKIKSYLSRQYHFDPNDSKALYVVNYEEQMSAFSKFFNGFNIFLVFVGCCLLLSGMIGVSNIMYIIVKERTREIGVKKAIGATSVNVLKEFMLEALVLTIISGLSGFLLGYAGLKILDVLIANFIGDDQIITHTVLEGKYLVLATFILAFSGLLAGFFPAQKAAEIKPVEAINSI